MSELLDPTFLLGQLRSGLTTAMFLFLIASGLSLIFGVLKIINFAHGHDPMLKNQCPSCIYQQCCLTAC
jgi:branched-subunit amino acid ABC-type transport system permease component